MSWLDDLTGGNVAMEGPNTGQLIPQAPNEGNITNPEAMAAWASSGGIPNLVPSEPTQPNINWGVMADEGYGTLPGLTNLQTPNITPSGGGGATGGIIPPSTPPVRQSAADLARADAMAEWEAHQAAVTAGKKPADSGFALSPMFYFEHPDVSGGMALLPGRAPIFMFNENKPKDTLTAANDLVRQLSEKVSSALSGGDASMAQFFGTQLKTIMDQIAPMTNAATTAGKAPSEIAANTATANRPQLMSNIVSGPGGEMSSFLVPPGGAPTKIATGISPSAEHGANIGSLITNIMIHHNAEMSKLDLDPFFQVKTPAEQQAIRNAVEERTRNSINGIQSIMNKPSTAVKPTLDQFLIAARKTNPGWNDAAITSEYYKRYGR